MTTFPDAYTGTIEIYSNHQKYNETFNIQITLSKLTISCFKDTAICSELNGEMKWSGTGCEISNPLIHIFAKQAIFAPFVVIELLEYALRKWMNNEITESEMTNFLRELANWISTTTKNIPSNTVCKESLGWV